MIVTNTKLASSSHENLYNYIPSSCSRSSSSLSCATCSVLVETEIMTGTVGTKLHRTGEQRTG
jgi:hypothetical protein